MIPAPIALTLALLVLASATASDPLPLEAPVPSPNPLARDVTPTAPAPSPRTAADRSQRGKEPSTTKGESPAPDSADALPGQLEEKPAPRPATGEEAPSEPDADETKPKEQPRLVSPPRLTPSAAEEAACRQRLTSLGAKFTEQPPVGDPSGCAMPRPISLSDLGSGIGVQPPALVNCATAEALSRFLAGTGEKIAKEEIGSRLESVQQASGYVCRPRNGTAKLSEHAFGNAIDIASFTLMDGTVIAVDTTRNPKHSLFLSKVRTAACGPFKTVLGPGSDSDHATHFHFDLAMRRNGGTFCQ